MVNFLEVEKSLTENQILAFEQSVNFRLPKEYSEHLLKFNGGRCEPNVCYFYQRNWLGFRRLDATDVRYFFAIYDGEFDNLALKFEVYKIQVKRLQERILPFAGDSMGNLFCISCRGIDEGYIYFWDHEREVKHKSGNDDDDFRNLNIVAKSFNEFLLNLKS